MIGIAKPFVYRESVQAYFGSAEVRFPVDQLLAKKMSFVPQTFTLGEVSDFYKACLAARQTQIDYAQDMFDLWHRIWPEMVPSWQPVPYDSGDEDLSLDPLVRWENNFFQRNFFLPRIGIKANLWIWLSLSSPRGSEVGIGCTLMKGAQTMFKKSNVPEGWSWDKDDKRFTFSTDAGVNENGLDLAPFIAAAQRVMSVIDELACSR